MIRIISGTLKGKKLYTMPGKETRPTSDRLRESIFNILLRYPTPNMVVDLFAGTGAFGIEAVSRGAGFACLVDGRSKAVNLIKKNIRMCALEQKTKTIKWDLKKNLYCLHAIGQPADIVFMDPPYERGFIHSSLVHLLQSPILTPDTLVVVEHSVTEPLLLEHLQYHLNDERNYGQTRVSFLKKLR